MSVRIKKGFYKLLQGCNSASVERRGLNTGLKLLNIRHERKPLPPKQQVQGFLRRESMLSICNAQN